MTIVVSWISSEREFPTLWVVTDSRLSKLGENSITPLLDCGSKLFSIRITCSKPNKGFFDEVYYSTTIGMAFAGSSLYALNLYAFVSSSLGRMGSIDNNIPSLDEIAKHVKSAFDSLKESYIQTNFQSNPCEVSIFGYCPIAKKHRLFHIKHAINTRELMFNEFEFINHNSIHLMGSHTQDIYKKILSDRMGLIGMKFWRSPKTTIENIITEQAYPDIGGNPQLGISYPQGFDITPIYRGNNLQIGKPLQSVIYQGIDLNSNSLLNNIGGCFITTNSIPAG